MREPARERASKRERKRERFWHLIGVEHGQNEHVIADDYLAPHTLLKQQRRHVPASKAAVKSSKSAVKQQ